MKGSVTAHPPPTRAPTDAELIAGSRAEFGRLFDRYAPELYRYCARRIGPDVAEDAVAETFLIAYERRDRYDLSRPNAVPWLYGIATNVVRRHRAAEARTYKTVAATVEPEDDRAVDRADAQALVRAIAGALARLSRRHRDVLFLVAAGLDHTEIAVALGVTPGTVRSRLHRARAYLRGTLADKGLLPSTGDGR